MAVYHPSWSTSGCLVHSWHDSIIFNWISIWGLIQITGLTNSAGQFYGRSPFYVRRAVTSPTAFTLIAFTPIAFTPTAITPAAFTPTTATAVSLAAHLPRAVRWITRWIVHWIVRWIYLDYLKRVINDDSWWYIKYQYKVIVPDMMPLQNPGICDNISSR